MGGDDGVLMQHKAVSSGCDIALPYRSAIGRPGCVGGHGLAIYMQSSVKVRFNAKFLLKGARAA